MAGRYLVAVDSGLTVTKAVVFAADGAQVAASARRIEQRHPQPGFVERDMDAVWVASAAAIRGALAEAGIAGRDVAAVAPTGHGDGLYPVAADLRPVGPGILSLDSRAVDVLAGWRSDGVLDRALTLTGQVPMASSPAPVLAWLKRHRRADYDRIAWVLSCKDWLRLCLTGAVATDRTEASVSFTDVETQGYSTAALDLYGMPELHDRLPPILGPAEIAGTVTAEAAEATGLPEGLPVAAGLHDVTAAAVGLGTVAPGELSIVAGTYSINEVISTAPVRDARWMCRNGVEPGTWMNMALSPASSANIDWFLRTLCGADLDRAAADGVSVFDRLQDEIARAFEDDSKVVYHPFLYGSPFSDLASAGFFGLRGWHGRGHVLRAVFEGIAFNHRTHVDALRVAFPMAHARVAGGGARNPLLMQLFADTLGLAVETVDAGEVSALGAALCAAVGVGLYASVAEAAERTIRVRGRFEPDRQGTARAEEAYRLYLSIVDAMRPAWDRLAGGHRAGALPDA